MASNYTSNYKLCQWAAEDKVLRTEFNADNAKIDAALAGKASASTVSGLQSSLSSLQSTVDGMKTTMADKSTTNSLAQAIAQQAAALSGKGNCQLSVVSYTGAGQSGASYPNSLTFDAVPEVVFIGNAGRWLALVQGEPFTWAFGPSGGIGQVIITWSGKSVRWYSTNDQAQMNQSETTYTAIALTRLS